MFAAYYVFFGILSVTVVSQVFVGPQTYMVWALDDQGKVYVREAIFPDFPLGADWVAVTGITAVDLSVR